MARDANAAILLKREIVVASLIEQRDEIEGKITAIRIRIHLPEFQDCMAKAKLAATFSKIPARRAIVLVEELERVQRSVKGT